MPPLAPFGYRLMIVDDDMLTREVLVLLAERAGFEVRAFESGTAALDALAADEPSPQGVLADLQMPEPSGEELATLLREACAVGTALIAMSATDAPEERRGGYDAFLLKPFSMEQLCAVLDRSGASLRRVEGEGGVALIATTFDAISDSMSREQLQQLYAMFVDDADSRIDEMRQAATAHDEDAWRRAAHSIKGSGGMVGAAELAGLAAAMERGGIPKTGSLEPFREILAACARLKRILADRIP